MAPLARHCSDAEQNLCAGAVKTLLSSGCFLCPLALQCVSQSTAWLPLCPVQDGKSLVSFFF